MKRSFELSPADLEALGQLSKVTFPKLFFVDTVNFDVGANGQAIAPGLEIHVGAPYAAWGITFVNPAGGVWAQASPQAHSSPNVVSNQLNNPASVAANGKIRATFASPVASASIWAASGKPVGEGLPIVALDAYDQEGNRVSKVTATLQAFTNVVASPQIGNVISYVEFWPEYGESYFDDLTVTWSVAEALSMQP